ncbi:MAG: T9SS type A sorting domain-containing protein [Saprospiraceae bacterium]
MRTSVIFLLFVFFNQTFLAQELTTCGQLADEPPGCFLCDRTVTFRNEGFTPEYPGQEFQCGSVENSFWISVIPTEPEITITLESSNCDKGHLLQFLLYNQLLEPVTPCYGSSDWGAMNAKNLVPGELYYLMVDGFDGAVCDMGITFVSGIYIPEAKTPKIKSPENIPDTVCIGEPVCIELENQIPFVGFEWNTDFESDIQTFAKGQNACIRFTRPGLNEIEISSINPCNNPDTSVFVSIFVKSPGINSFLDTTICEGTCLVFYDSTFCGAGYHFYFHNINDPELCDSVDLINIDFHPNPFPRETREICKGDSTFWKGTYPYNEGRYAFNHHDSLTGCDYKIELDLYTKDTFYTNLIFEFNEGDTLNGIVLTNDTMLVYNLSTIDGCDSTVLYQIQVKKSGTNSPGIQEEPMTIFPNPNNGNFFIEWNIAEPKASSYTIKDLSGRLILQGIIPGSGIKIPVQANLSSGVYFLEVSSGQEKWSRRFVVLN